MKSCSNVLFLLLFILGSGKVWSGEVRCAETNAFYYVLYTHISLSNVACRLSPRIRMIDGIASLDEQQLIWCSERASAILGLNVESNALQELANTVGVKLFLLDPETMSDGHVVSLRARIGEEINRKIKLRISKENRENKNVTVRVEEFKSLLWRERIGPIHFAQCTREKVIADMFEKINHRLRSIDAEFGLSYVHETFGQGIDETLYTFDIPVLPIARAIDIMTDNIECTVTNRYGYYEFKPNSKSTGVKENGKR